MQALSSVIASILGLLVVPNILDGDTVGAFLLTQSHSGPAIHSAHLSEFLGDGGQWQDHVSAFHPERITPKIVDVQG